MEMAGKENSKRTFGGDRCALRFGPKMAEKKGTWFGNSLRRVGGAIKAGVNKGLGIQGGGAEGVSRTRRSAVSVQRERVRAATRLDAMA